MDEKKILEEHLREAASIGDINLVQELINLGVDVNSKHSINGWTPLHWACKRNFHEIVLLLLKNGADKNIQSEKGETPGSVTSNPYISQLLSVPVEFSKNTDQQERQEPYTYVPNYLRNDSSNCKTKIQLDFPQETINTCQEEIILKIRIANELDLDFIEVDLSRNCLSYQNLIKLCCDELEINASQILKLRKLPNTKIRRDKDVQRLENYQEIEVVLYPSSNDNDSSNKLIQQTNGSAIPITPTNNYQSISKKDQTILY